MDTPKPLAQAVMGVPHRRRARRIARDAARRRGAIFLGVLWVNVIVLLTTVSYFSFFQSLLRTVRLAHDRDQTLALAEAGLASAKWEILRNGGVNLGPTPSSGWLDGNAECNAFGLAVTSCRRLQRTLSATDGSNAAAGTFTVWVVNVGSPLVRIVAQGSIPASSAATQTVTLDLQQSPTFQYAAFGGTSLNIGQRNRAIIDSYDSALGPYNVLTNRGARGDVGTNGDGADQTDLIVSNTGTELRGIGWLTPGDTYNIIPAFQPTGGMRTQTDLTLPPVRVPPALEALGRSTGNLVDAQGKLLSDPLNGGRYTAQDWTCDGSYRFKSLTIWGEFRMTNNCQLLIDNPTASGAPLDTNGEGRLVKLGTAATTQIFVRVRNGYDGVNLDGGGIVWDGGVREADRRPDKLQLYVTCAYPPCPRTTRGNLFAQGHPFYGVVYMEGDAEITRGSVNGVPSDGSYYGAFVTTGNLRIDGQDMRTAYIHYDERLRNLAIDGSGGRGAYRIRPGSWNSK